MVKVDNNEFIERLEKLFLRSTEKAGFGSVFLTFKHCVFH